MRVIVTIHMKKLVYTGVVLVTTKGNEVTMTLKDDYTVSDQSFSSKYNVSFIPFINHFVDCSSVIVVDN